MAAGGEQRRLLRGRVGRRPRVERAAEFAQGRTGVAARQRDAAQHRMQVLAASRHRGQARIGERGAGPAFRGVDVEAGATAGLRQLQRVAEPAVHQLVALGRVLQRRGDRRDVVGRQRARHACGAGVIERELQVVWPPFPRLGERGHRQLGTLRAHGEQRLRGDGARGARIGRRPQRGHARLVGPERGALPGNGREQREQHRRERAPPCGRHLPAHHGARQRPAQQHRRQVVAVFEIQFQRQRGRFQQVPGEEEQHRGRDGRRPRAQGEAGGEQRQHAEQRRQGRCRMQQPGRPGEAVVVHAVGQHPRHQQQAQVIQQHARLGQHALADGPRPRIQRRRPLRQFRQHVAAQQQAGQHQQRDAQPLRQRRFAIAPVHRRVQHPGQQRQQRAVGLARHRQQRADADAADHPRGACARRTREQRAAVAPGQQAEQAEGGREHGLALHDVQRGGDEQGMQQPQAGAEQRRGVIPCHPDPGLDPREGLAAFFPGAGNGKQVLRLRLRMTFL